MTDALSRAIIVAAWAHDGQYRKGTHVPYATHPFSVMLLIHESGGDEITKIAGLLHDVLEDVPSDRYSRANMMIEFGPEVVETVEGVTHNMHEPNWLRRNQQYIDHLAHVSERSLIVSAADKLHNISAMLGDHERIGDALWERFVADKSAQQWWYRGVYEALNQRISEHDLVRRLEREVLRFEML